MLVPRRVPIPLMGRLYICLRTRRVDFSGINIGKCTVRPMDASWVIGEHGEQHELLKSSTWIVTGSDQWVNPNISNL